MFVSLEEAKNGDGDFGDIPDGGVHLRRDFDFVCRGADFARDFREIGQITP
jgi:hypothetical protein